MNTNSLAESQTVVDWSPGHILLDDFEVVRVLGEGGMGKVYLVRSLSSQSQFAIKRSKALNEVDRKAFLAELQTWIDLPDHPNLVPCRFFRTVGSEVLIFAEYVEGGSLKDWIDSRRLYEGGHQQALERMLDIAIQLAWGLHCVHELGTIHQDVKPGNVLISTDGMAGLQGIKPQVTDFGLARARAASGEDFITAPCGSILVSTIRGTPAYWSPEQSLGMPLTNKSDMWSWALSVMELFTGGLTWMSGLGAAEVLEQYRQEAEYDDGIPAMPFDVANLLCDCFHQDPPDRPGSLANVAVKLQKSYLDCVGFEYDRTLDVIEKTPSPQAGIKARRTISGTAWKDPLVFLKTALRAAGRDSAEAAPIAQRTMSRRGELVADIVIYDQAKQIYTGLIRQGKMDLEGTLATLCEAKALVHRAAADEPGAINEYDDAINIRERLLTSNKCDDQACYLAGSYQNKAICLSALGDKAGAVNLYDRAISIHERFIAQEGDDINNDSLARIYNNKANVLCSIGDNHGAIAVCDKAIEIRERLVHQKGPHYLSEGLARSYISKGIVLRMIGNYSGSGTLYDQAITIFERLVSEENRSDLASNLAGAYLNRGIVFRCLGNNSRAAALFDQAVSIWDRLANQECRSELAKDLALAYQSKATAVSAQGDQQGAIALCNQALTIYDRLVNQEGRREFADNLAVVYMIKANAFSTQEDKNGALILYDQAIAIRERMVTEGGRNEHAGDLAWLKACRGNILVELGDCDRGMNEMIAAEKALKEEISRTGQADHISALEWLQDKLEEHSS